MTTVSPSDQVIVLRDIAWETYERLLADLEESSGRHLTYDGGTLEIMAPSFGHARLKATTTLLFHELAYESDIDVLTAGSTTFRRKDLLKGFEPDGSFYIRQAETLRRQKKIDLSVHPPPDVVIDIEITHSEIRKLSIFAAFGVPEVWLLREDHVEIVGLESNTYKNKSESAFLPGVTGSVLTDFVQSSRKMKSTAWIKSVREWAANR